MNEDENGKNQLDVRNAWITGVISTFATLAASIIGTYNEAVKFTLGFDTWTLLDVLLMAGLTYGIYRNNRFCALTMLIYFVASKFILAASTGNFPGGILALVFIYLYYKGAVGTFKIYRHKAGVDGYFKKDNSLKLIIFSFFVVMIIVVLIIIGALSPGTEVIPGKFLKQRYANFIREKKLIDTNEQIEYWYSDAFLDFRKGFYFITNRNVVLYNSEWDRPSYIIPYALILDIKFKHNPSFFEDSKIIIFLIDNSIVELPVSSDNDGDKKFLEKLLQLWKKGKLRSKNPVL
ncbi:MAG: hypothetical protein OEV78_05945 [Spirochaetia bacterium]|nr:hypothetical protein [Spirochaetia bacterium]